MLDLYIFLKLLWMPKYPPCLLLSFCLSILRIYPWKHRESPRQCKNILITLRFNCFDKEKFPGKILSETFDIFLLLLKQT